MSLLRFEKASQLSEWLSDQELPSIVLGSQDENVTEFLGARLPPGHETMSIGIYSIGGGIVPRFLVGSKNIAIGYNRVISILDTAGMMIAEIQLLSLFVEFIEMPDSRDYFLVVGESVLLAIAWDGKIRWRIDTDWIESAILQGTQVRLSFVDDAPIAVNIVSGHSLPSIL